MSHKLCRGISDSYVRINVGNKASSKGKKKKASSIDYAKALHVPDGGYDEDEDCINAEDESYREALEVMEKEVREVLLAIWVEYV